MQQKLKEWIQRYLPAEIIGTITALISAGMIHSITHSYFAAAIAGTWGENAGYYSFILFQEIRSSRRHHQTTKENYRIIAFLKNIRNIVLEFGVAEWLDSGFVRPFMMYIFPKLLGNFELGILAGKIAADIVFYISVIIAYELRRKHLQD
ncbi:hypothetical protein K9N68_09510 [Kovacikia minuta CCNUW1]|uniref:hypothetical protein n=1 Tax=Kovacikia minuta TaxID=2931930 RepID=UPI001CCFE93B|nr:hypothetical protein [Kovacikia minuta]UBF28095.1 hypothetical protein K9N68_09510 [Kovacikia minuta CCNUW1]